MGAHPRKARYLDRQQGQRTRSHLPVPQLAEKATTPYPHSAISPQGRRMRETHGHLYDPAKSRHVVGNAVIHIARTDPLAPRPDRAVRTQHDGLLLLHAHHGHLIRHGDRDCDVLVAQSAIAEHWP